MPSMAVITMQLIYLQPYSFQAFFHIQVVPGQQDELPLTFYRLRRSVPQTEVTAMNGLGKPLMDVLHWVP
jgi:hypothetical protein